MTIYTDVRRLMALDAALASPDGLCVPTVAQTLGVPARTITRDLATLTELGHTHAAERLPDGSYRHRYNRDVTPLYRATPLPDKRRLNRAGGRPPISAKIRRQIIERLDTGLTPQQIAEAGLASYGTVYRIAKSRRGQANK